ncbi:MAG: hypothetical protein U5R31_09160, partial [Acidimicrobiia bacterium]|nr:hypothetical protein [Acidimicrobiia bacterium]
VRDLVREGLAMRRSQGLTWSQVAMAANAPMLTRAAMVDGHPEVGILPTGQVVGEIDELPTVGEVVERVVAEATATLTGPGRARHRPGRSTTDGVGRHRPRPGVPGCPAVPRARSHGGPPSELRLLDGPSDSARWS